MRNGFRAENNHTLTVNPDPEYTGYEAPIPDFRRDDFQFRFGYSKRIAIEKFEIIGIILTAKYAENAKIYF